MDFASLFPLMLLLISPAVGSFLALLVDRLPRGENYINRPSACRACGARLGARDLLPVLSYVLQRGRCRHCDTAIPPAHLYVELMAIGLAVLAAIVAQSPLHLLFGSLFLWCLLALGVSDLIWRRLPDLLTGTLFLLGLGLAWEDPNRSLLSGLFGAAIGSGSFLALRLGYQKLRQREGLGLGDVKLMAGLGAGLGALALPYLCLLAAGGALLFALIQSRRTKTPLSSDIALPFGAALCAAAAVLWLI